MVEPRGESDAGSEGWGAAPEGPLPHSQRPGEHGVVLGSALEAVRSFEYLHVDRRRDVERRWRVTGQLAELRSSRQLVITTLTIAAAESGDPATIDSDLLRRLSIPTVLAAAVQQRDTVMRTAYEQLFEQRAQWDPPSAPRARKRTRSPERMEELRRFSEAYLEEQGSRGLYARLGARLARNGTPMPGTTIRENARVARELKFLASTGRGRGVAQAGPRLLEMRDRPGGPR